MKPNNEVNKEMEKLLSTPEDKAKRENVLKALEKARAVRSENIKKEKEKSTPLCKVPPPIQKSEEKPKLIKQGIFKKPLPMDKLIPIEKGAGFGFFKKMKMYRNPSITYLITMLYGNGTMKHFIILTTKDMFTLNKKKYHLNKNEGWYDINFHQHRLMYHVDYVEPINKELKIEGDKAYMSLNPENIEPVLSMEYIKVLSQSQTLTKWIKMVLLFVVIILALNFINVIVFVLQSGIFKGLMSSFG